jgi:hypothetical protein
MSIDILPFKKELLKNWKYDGTDKEISGSEIAHVIEYYAELGECYIGAVDGKVLGVGGAYPLWQDAGGCFLFLNKEAKNYKKSIFKALLKYMNILVKKYGIKTLTVECIDDSLEAHRLIRHLGFTKNKEIKMALYTKGV